ncbi:MAG: TorD/DmsD family molecular chaperone [Planctomycetota bacterium]|jgi:TorA maturation chaperone TorD
MPPAPSPVRAPSPEAKTALARSQTYRFFAQVFLEKPTQTLLEAFRDGRFLSELGDVFGTEAGSPLTAGPGNLEDLQEEYDALFRVPAGRYVTPYESVYRGEARKDKKNRPGGCLMGEETLEVLAWFKCTGYFLQGSCKELPDHLGCEFEFVGRMCAEESDAHAEGKSDLAAKWRNAQRRFLENHLLRWFPEVAQKIRENDRLGFYALLTELASRFLEHEVKSLSQT